MIHENRLRKNFAEDDVEHRAAGKAEAQRKAKRADFTKEITQPLIYAPRNPILVTLFALTTCYLAATAIDKLLQPTLKLKNKFY